MASIANFKLKMTIYKADSKTNIYYIIGFVIFIGVTVLLSSRFTSSDWTSLVIILLLYIIFTVVISRLTEIQLDKIDSSLTFIHKNYIGIKKTLKYDLRNVS
jgi:hypothetical protein